MPVFKYRSIADMPGPPALPPLHPANLRRALDLTGLGARLLPLDYVPGVRKFGSFDEALRHRQARETAAARRAQALDRP